MALIDLDLAAKHVNVDVTISENVETLLPKLEHATALVITYIKRPDHTWTVATSPREDMEFAIVQAAILKVLTNLYAWRGDEQPRVNPLDEGVKIMLDLFKEADARMTAGDLKHWVTLDDFKEDGTPVVFHPSRMPVALYPDTASSFDEDRKGHVVWMRYHPQVTTNTRITHRGRQLAVRGIHNVNEQNEWLELRCEEVLTP